MTNGFKDVHIPEPLGVLVPRWDENELFRGAFSFLPAGTFKDGFEDLQRNVGRVYFAGEGVHDRYSGYL